jgi:hypothetical protein
MMVLKLLVEVLTLKVVVVLLMALIPTPKVMKLMLAIMPRTLVDIELSQVPIIRRLLVKIMQII